MAKQPQVYVVSDSLGETAESVAKATIGQYDTDIEIHRVPFIRHMDQIEKLLMKRHRRGLWSVTHWSVLNSVPTLNG